MGFGDTTALLSSFTGADETPLSENGHWANLSTAHGDNLQRVSNQVGCIVSTTGESYWTVFEMGPDLDVLITISVMPLAGNNIDISARIQGEGGNNTYDGYRLRMIDNAGTDQLAVTRVDNSLITALATFDRNFTAGEMIGLRCFGNAIQGWYNDGSGWIFACGAIDTTYPLAGKVAIHVRGTTGRADEMYVGAYATPVSLPHIAGHGAA